MSLNSTGHRRDRLDMDDLLGGCRDRFPSYFAGNSYIQHNPWVADNLTGLVSGLQALAARGSAVKYEKVHRVLGEGNFVLVVSEGTFGDRPQLNGRKHAGNPVDRHQTPVRQSR